MRQTYGSTATREADFNRYWQFENLRHDLLQIFQRRKAYAEVMKALLRAYGAGATLGDLRAAGVLDSYPPLAFGLPYEVGDLVGHQAPPDLNEALVLRRWLAEHPPTVSLPA